MPEKILESVLGAQQEPERLLAWLRGENVEGWSELARCGRAEFAAFFVSFLRAQTDSILQSSGGARAVLHAGTPERAGGAGACGEGGRPHRRSVSDPALGPDSDTKHRLSPAPDKKRSGRKVKTKLFPDERSKESLSPDEPRAPAATSTPVRAPAAPSTPVRADREPDTPRSSRHPRAPDSTPTLGDFLSSAQKASSKKKRSKNTSDDSDVKAELDISSPDSFPEIGARKASSLRSERRRIKPTNIDLTKKSISLNNFNSQVFQYPSPLALEDNLSFSARSPGAEGDERFAADRAALRRERHRLVEKFNSLSAAGSPRCLTPLVKLTPALPDRCSYITPDITKVTSEDKLEVLARIYDVLLEHNLIAGYTTELYFLMSLVLARQAADDAGSEDEGHLLKSVHNAAFFATRTLWAQRGTLIQLLDGGSLRALGEAKSVRGLAPELAKCLLNEYGVRREATSSDPRPPRSPRSPRAGAGGGGGGGVVAWNSETDNADNFPSTLSFQSFKKQRDMFSEIVRWWWETGGGGGGPGPSLRARVRALLAAGAAGGPVNHAHLGVLIVRHLVSSTACEQSRLSKLQRRLTRPPGPPALFTPEEELYKELVSCSESEGFRAHVRDAAATELLALDQADHTGGGLLQATLSARSLGKLLGLLASLPYVAAGGAAPPGAPQRPHEDRLLRNAIALRSYSVPALDVHSLVAGAAGAGRLVVTLPWAASYLAALDAAALRLPYYRRLLRLLRALHRARLAPPPSPSPSAAGLADRTRLYLRCTLAWLFAQPHVPQETLYEEESEWDEECACVVERQPRAGADHADLVGDAELGGLLAARREAAGLLLAGGAADGSVRHVTPLRVGGASDRHLQRRLEEGVSRAAGGGARRAVELVADRVAARALTALRGALQEHRGCSSPCSTAAILCVGESARERLGAALAALVAEGALARALAALAARGVRARLARHAAPHTAPGALCPAAQAAVRELLAGGWREPARSPPSAAPPPPPPSAAEALLDLKERVCLALEGSLSTAEAEQSLRTAAAAVGALTAGGEPSSPPAGAAGPAPGCARPVRRAALQLSLDLCVALARSRPLELTEQFLQSAERVWAACLGGGGGRPAARAPSPPPRAAPDGRGARGDSRAPSPDSEPEPGARPRLVNATSPPAAATSATSAGGTRAAAPPPPPEEEELVELFSRVASPRNVQLLAGGAGGPAGWQALGRLLAFSARRGWLHEAALTEGCVALYRTDWPQAVVAGLGGVLRAAARGAEGRRAPFVDFLADYCEDLGAPAEDAC